MLEAKLSKARILKKLLDAIKELVDDANFKCNEEGITLQAMDNSHIMLMSVLLEAMGFKHYCCNCPMLLSINLNSFTKVLKCTRDDDECTIKAADEADILNLVFEAKSSYHIAEYDMKLMNINTNILGIPDMDYNAHVTMPSSEFTCIMCGLSLLGKSVQIEVLKEGVHFASDGEAANGSILLCPSDKEAMDGDGEMDGDDEFKANLDDEGEEEKKEDEESKEGGKKHKKSLSSNKPSKKAQTALSLKCKGKKEEEKEEQGICIEMHLHVLLTFSLKYLINFSKSTSLSSHVQFIMSNGILYALV
ncbi:Proliferating cell nuclear antigen [Termitomyces sp. T112]|nr:Proliferating cell nuclear antigen [Termitomyces sp. T112]